MKQQPAQERVSKGHGARRPNVSDSLAVTSLTLMSPQQLLQLKGGSILKSAGVVSGRKGVGFGALAQTLRHVHRVPLSKARSRSEASVSPSVKWG